MQNDSPIQVQPQTDIQPNQQSVLPVTNEANEYKSPNKKQNAYEYVLLGSGTLAILSLLFNNGFSLKLTAAIFLVVAVISIVRSISAPKQQVLASGPILASEKSFPKKRSPLTIVGIILIVVILVPIVPYLFLILFFIIAMLFGGGNMGT